MADETKPADSTPPPIVGPLLALTKSRKAIVMVAAVAAAAVLVALGKATIEQAGIFIGAVVGVWMNSVAKEDAAAKGAE